MRPLRPDPPGLLPELSLPMNPGIASVSVCSGGQTEAIKDIEGEVKWLTDKGLYDIFCLIIQPVGCQLHNRWTVSENGGLRSGRKGSLYPIVADQPDEVPTMTHEAIILFVILAVLVATVVIGFWLHSIQRQLHKRELELLKDLGPEYAWKIIRGEK
jgi:hypothetical protein